ncbi:hypothetical protein A2866_04865 [Candidatus Roizmanbacteria bacterium RIFCSPHIGHO2_01_FULL_39_8]|uniref:GlcNAc-PI de-N-acetylase n=2 Tax=Candidatus Roizmaniibacteriota TaxID=1752723 RepID=A0A1F7GPT9_9BACT|nr:MAG: hypothetical protein A2866_04865 [Candidatus Roizmanbacteria bacterium RIFCSPHIGHO2_01_FULL_39_8]OGK26952.1 MAG: hypothetical protein A3C28_06390 [Candidatus Roizmanbacteria bacterium RIFCSPHIGHO2_02_FULL_39_9]
MKQSVVCVFAHPDDEAFGPGGTIAKFSQTHDVTILCATKGEAGGKAEVREQELRQSAKILGVKQVIFLGFKDGTLCNLHYHTIAAKIKKVIKRIKPSSLLTFEPRGVSGHIDHIAVSMITSYLYEHVSSIKTLYYFCLSKEQVAEEKKLDDYFIYFPPGYSTQDVDMIFDVSDVWDTKVNAMKAHRSQKKDVDLILSYLNRLPKKEYFLVLRK